PLRAAWVQVPAGVRQPLEELRAGMENVIGGFILAGLLVAAGLAALVGLSREVIQSGGKLPFHTDKGLSWTAVGLWGLVGAGLLVGGFFLWQFAAGLRSRRVWVCANGLYFVWARSAEAVPWEQIESVTVTVAQEYFPLKGIASKALPMGKSRSYVIRRKDGYEVGVDANAVRRIGRFGQILEERAEQHGFKWQVVQASA